MSQSTENLFESTRLSDDSAKFMRSMSANFNETRVIKSSLNDESVESLNRSNSLSKIRVFLRLKPRAAKSKRARKIQEEMYVVANSSILITTFPSGGCSSVGKLKSTDVSKRFVFAKIFKSDSTQDEVFRECASDTILDFLLGQNSTLMSYGTTDSGKTFTLYGTSNCPGIIPRSIEFIFSALTCTLSPWYKPLYGFEVINLDEERSLLEMKSRERLLSSLPNASKMASVEIWKSLQNSKQRIDVDGDAMYSVWLSFAEVYNENVYDLLGEVDEEKVFPLKLVTDKHGRSFVPGLTMIPVTTGLEAYQVLLVGQSRLSVSSEPPGSSLSHSVFSITLLKYIKEGTPEDVEVSTLTFCDLAGAGRSKKSCTDNSAKEARSIKTGLLALGRCLQSIYEYQCGKSNEVVGPFRESKLTRLFQRPLSGKEPLTIIATVNPSAEFYVENQSILHLCSIARRIIVTPARELKRSFTSDLTLSSPPKNLPAKIREEDADSVEQCEDCGELREKNVALLREIEVLKSTISIRELNIRDEMANFCSTMMKDMESNWRLHARVIEEDQEDLLKWSVKHLETFYKERIDSLTHRKRKRTDYDDTPGDQSSVDMLEAENHRITAKYIAARDNFRILKREHDMLKTQKNACAFELGLVKKKLREIREFLASEETSNSLNYSDLLRHLKLLIFKKNERIKLLEVSLNEALGNQSREQIEAEDTENQSQNTTNELNSLFIGESMQSNSSDSTSDVTIAEVSVVSTLTYRKSTELPDPQNPKFQSIFETIDKTLDPIRMTRQEDSGIVVSNRISNSTRTSVFPEVADKSTQATDFAELEKKIIEDRLSKLKLDYKKLQSEHLDGSIRIEDLSKDLDHIRRVMQSLKEVMRQSDQKIVEYQLKLASRDADLKSLKECNIDLESKLSKAYLNLQQSSLQCAVEHTPKINKLQDEVVEKAERIACLTEKISTVERDLRLLHTLNDKVCDFADKLDKCKRERDELRCQLHERTLSQSSLECRLKLLSSRVQNRENEIRSLRTDLAGIVTTNRANGERASELSSDIANALVKLTTVREEVRRSEVERRELERASSHEISNLAEHFRRNAAVLTMIHDGDEDTRSELERLTQLLLKRDRELALFKKNRDSTIRRYELLVRKLQGDVERNNRELLRVRKHSKRAVSKESLESVEQESSREVGGALIKARSCRRTFNIKNRKARHHCRLTCSAKRVSSQIVASLTSLETKSHCRGGDFCHKANSGTKVKVHQADHKEVVIPEATTASVASTSDDSSTDYKELSNWMKIKKTNGRTQFVIRQAEITVENAIQRQLSD